MGTSVEFDVFVGCTCLKLHQVVFFGSSEASSSSSSWCLPGEGHGDTLGSKGVTGVKVSCRCPQSHEGNCQHRLPVDSTAAAVELCSVSCCIFVGRC